MSTLSIQLFGDFRLSAGASSIATLTQARQLALLAYLLLHHTAPQTRQHLAFLPWPDSSERQAPVNDNYTYPLATITFAHKPGVQTTLPAKKAGGEDGLHRCASEATDERKSSGQKPGTSSREGEC